ncbi:hypothetical protein L7F22_030387 [Adiantum nelumboides]|nr:hypothetical protein [Adiantum nelumboides]
MQTAHRHEFLCSLSHWNFIDHDLGTLFGTYSTARCDADNSLASLVFCPWIPKGLSLNTALAFFSKFQAKLLNNVSRMVATCLVLHNMCIIHEDAFDDAWVQEAPMELEKARQEAIAIRDMDLQNIAQIGLQEVTATTLMDARQMEQRAQSDTPLDGSTVGDGKTRRDSLFKVMFAEHQKKAVRAAFSDDSTDECYGSDSDNDEPG